MPDKCEKCGATSFVKENGMYVCQYCGASYPIEQHQQSKKDSSEHADSSTKANVRMSHPSSNKQIPSTIRSNKSWTTTVILSIFLGFFGAHRFYAGKIGTGIMWFLTFGWFGIGWIVDLIAIAMGRFTDKQGKLIRHH